MRLLRGEIGPEDADAEFEPLRGEALEKSAEKDLMRMHWQCQSCLLRIHLGSTRVGVVTSDVTTVYGAIVGYDGPYPSHNGCCCVVWSTSGLHRGVGLLRQT